MLIELNNSHGGSPANLSSETARANMRQGYFVDSVGSSGSRGKSDPLCYNFQTLNFNCKFHGSQGIQIIIVGKLFIFACKIFGK